MTKKIVAKTNIAHGKDDGTVVEFKPGDEVNPRELGLSKGQIEQLYDAGAIELQETADAREEAEEKSDSQENVSPAKKAAPAKATTSEVKSSGTSNAT